MSLAAWFEARPRRLVAAAFIAALAVYLPTVGTGFVLDDHVHRFALLGMPGPSSGLNLFDFTPARPEELAKYIESGPYPWWTSPEIKVRFFRPLSSALLQLDHAVFPDNAVAAHLHSVLWGLAMLWAGWLVLRRLLPPTVAGLALCIFALSESHWMPVAWIANRNSVVAAVFGLLGFVAHLRWRDPSADERRHVSWPVLSFVAFALSLCAAEAGLGFLALPFAWELTRPAPPRVRVAALVPALIAFAGFVAIYKLGGYGARASGAYIDPATAPLAYLREAPVRLLVLIGNLLANAPADVWLSLPRSRPWIIAESLAALGVAVWLFRRMLRELDDNERRLARFLAVAALFALIPTAATFPMARLVLPASISAAALLSLAVRSLWRNGPRWLGWLVLVTHLALPLLFWFGSTAIADRIGRNAAQAARDMELEPRWENLRVVVLGAPDPSTFLYLPLERAVSLRTMPRSWWVLTQVPLDLSFVRTGPNTFELSILGGRMLDGVYEQVVRSMEVPFSVGERVRLSTATIEVLAVDEGHPTRIRFELDEPLDAPDLRILSWRDGTMRRFALPPIGEVVTIPWEPGPIPN